MSSSRNTAVLILAAGASSRMGRAKQLLPWGDTTLLGSVIETAIASDARSVTVVLGANAASIQEAIAGYNVDVVRNEDWSSGLGSSIASGTEFLLIKKNKPDGILIMLGDQPLIDTQYLNSMMATFDPRKESIVATAYDNRAGVPALFPFSCFGALLKLKDDFGAKEIISKNDVKLLHPYKKTMDIDTESDFQKLNDRFK